MCDFSLMHVKSRAAQVADKVITKDFGTGTFGFCPAEDAEKVYHESTAVCVLPGTEIEFDEPVKLREGWHLFGSKDKPPKSQVARFRQINLDSKHMHHDALEFADGEIILLTYLATGQKATVLQLPAAPKTEEEAKEQTRLEIVA